MDADIVARNVRLAEALGLDPTKIRKGGVRLILDPERGPVVEVEYRWSDAMAGELVTELARYQLVPIEEDAG